MDTQKRKQLALRHSSTQSLQDASGFLARNPGDTTQFMVYHGFQVCEVCRGPITEAKTRSDGGWRMPNKLMPRLEEWEANPQHDSFPGLNCMRLG
jgi:hypothetical protein